MNEHTLIVFPQFPPQTLDGLLVQEDVLAIQVLKYMILFPHCSSNNLQVQLSWKISYRMRE